jgi:acyl-coenzyme A synthetase/AMP-(fatty) acid ligase
MLKCSGYRVEPAEIEQCINQLDTIESCAVVGIKDLTSGQREKLFRLLTNNSLVSVSISSSASHAAYPIGIFCSAVKR